MFEDLNWRGAVKRAGIAALLYLLFIYVLETAFPETFGAGSNLASALIIAAAFFMLYVPTFAFADRRKRRRLSQMQAEKKGARPGARSESPNGDAEDDGEGADLRGRRNPNTSRRKTARQRRRR